MPSTQVRASWIGVCLCVCVCVVVVVVVVVEGGKERGEREEEEEEEEKIVLALSCPTLSISALMSQIVMEGGECGWDSMARCMRRKAMSPVPPATSRNLRPCVCVCVSVCVCVLVERMEAVDENVQIKVDKIDIQLHTHTYILYLASSIRSHYGRDPCHFYKIILPESM